MNVTRSERIFVSALSGYVVIITNVAYTILSIPIALHYLSKEQFGLWALVAQLTGYLSLLDLGMSNSTSRLLIDHKDDRNGQQFGGLIKTSSLVCLLQSAIILVATFLLFFVGAKWLNIEPHLINQFNTVMVAQGCITALGFSGRIFYQLLYAYQRIDLINWITALQFVIMLWVQWLAFKEQMGVISISVASLAGFIFILSSYIYFCFGLNLFPDRGCWGKASWIQFKQMFSYGLDMFLISLGTQMVLSSQTIIITRSLGLDASAVWSVCSKSFTLGCQFVWKFFDVSAPALSEMIVRHDDVTLKRRYEQIVQTTLAFATIGALAITVTNSPFITVWTNGKIHWNIWNDFLLGIWLVVTTYNHCHSSLVIWTKQAKFLRYIYFLEGIFFIGLGLIATKYFGLIGLIVASIFCTTIFSGAYTLLRAAHILLLPWQEIGWAWFKRSALVALCFIPAVIGLEISSSRFSPLTNLWLSTGIVAVFGGFLLLRLGLPRSILNELLNKLPRNSRSFFCSVANSK